MLENKVAIVTGAARGIGLEISRRIAANGASVGMVDIDPDGLAQACDELAGQGLKIMPLVADVRAHASVAELVSRVLGQWDRVDILVNNAGVCPLTPILEIRAEDWDRVLGINLKGAFLCSQAVIPTMLSQCSGKIINIASSAGQMGGLAVGVHYSASKAGLLGLTKSLARILAPEIQVNAVSPGTTESEMTRGWDEGTVQNIVRQIPAGRLGRPADVAAAVLFLASDEAGFITGQTLNVNGGLWMG